MSELYPDLNNLFPNEIDTFDKYVDPNIESIQAIKQYYTFFDAGNIVSANAILEANPQLKTMIINAERLNILRDMCISVERFFHDDVQQYLVNIINYRGEWNNTTRYVKNDVVQYTVGSSIQDFIVIELSVPLGTLPTNSVYYHPRTLRGEKGESGSGLTPRGVWLSSETYYKDDCVAHNNMMWVATETNSNSAPQESNSNWSLYMKLKNQIILDSTTPTTQTVGDFYFNKISDTQTEIFYKNISSLYEAVYPKTLAANVILASNKTVEEAMPLKADLVDGKIPEEQLPMTGGTVVSTTPPENTKLTWIDISLGANKGIQKYHNGTAWVQIMSTWG